MTLPIWDAGRGAVLGRIDPVRRMVQLALPEPEVRARATSGTTVEVVDRRLEELRRRDDAAAVGEIEYLRGVRERLKGG